MKQDTPLALRCFLARPRPMMHNQGVKFIEQLEVMGQEFHEEPLEPAIVVLTAEPLQPCKQTVSVRINDENRIFSRVKQDRVRCLLTDSVN